MTARAAKHYHTELRLLLLPYLLGTLLLVGLPALLTFALAFFQYDALSAPQWVGLWNFQDIFGDPLLWVALRNSLYFIFLAVPLQVLLAVTLALLLNQRRRGTGLYRAAVYLPTVIPDVAFALIALWIFNPLYGPLNLVLRGLGLPAPDWLINPDTAKLVFVIMSLFQIGEAFVILLIGLQDIPPEVNAAAAVDGSSARQTLRHITLPLLLPWIALVTFRAVMVSFQWTFTPSLIMTGGDPYYATLFMPLIIYEEAFDRFRFGPGAAMMLIVVVMTLYFISTLYILFKNRGYVDEAV
ncbi:Melibiose/raffinose/stachyose import permease protein MelD [Thermoflexales bacterium]|nr:Melibiose/raffinose/stachyose import permease protein MelD [Thermoflexales bacterium]